MSSLPPKRILCHAPSTGALERLSKAVLAARESEPTAAALEWHFHSAIESISADLAASYVNLVVFDLHGVSSADLAQHAGTLFDCLDRLDRGEDIEARFAFDRILVLLPIDSSAGIDELVLRLGARGVRAVCRLDGALGDAAFGATLTAAVHALLVARRKGRRALCASGGGITGIYFELGALKCLDDALGTPGLEAFDMYFGISAGAVVTGPLSVGYTIDDAMAAIAGVPGGRMPPLDLRLFRLGHVDAPSFTRRAALAARTTAAAVRSAFTGRRHDRGESLLFDYAGLIAAPFRADRFERMLRDMLSAPGTTNDFRRLPRPLYIGATDQDERSHVLFGDETHDHVPISLAIQASLSINPAFSATRIDGRYYEDGAITRTSNFIEAIRRDATLVLVVDPFVPYVTREPGFADRRGMLYNIDQDVRTISYTRYEAARSWVLRQHPEVSAYTFVPGNRARRLLSVNPMDHRPFLEIWRGAYLSAAARLEAIEHRFAGDLRAHGLGFDLAPVRAVVERLEATETPSLADFFPNGRVTPKRTPFCLEETSAPPGRP